MLNRLLIELKDIRLIALMIIIILYISTIGFLLMFAPIGLHEAEKQIPHGFDGNKYLNYNTFDSIMKAMPIIVVIPVIILVVLIAKLPDSKQQKEIDK